MSLPSASSPVASPPTPCSCRASTSHRATSRGFARARGESLASGWPSRGPSFHRQRPQYFSVDQSPKVARHAGGQRPIANQDPELDVAVEGGIGEVRRGHEDRLAVRDHCLGVEHSRRAVEYRAIAGRSRRGAALRRASPSSRIDRRIGARADPRRWCRLVFAGCSTAAWPAARESRPSVPPRRQTPAARRSRRTCSPRPFVQPSPATLRTPASYPARAGPLPRDRTTPDPGSVTERGPAPRHAAKRQPLFP